jgi:hypothetical protein
MPRISEFYGIVIFMYWFDTQKHKTPHFHARYRGIEAVFDLSGNRVEGELSSTANRLIKKWSHQNSHDINQAWKIAKKGKELPWIKPLS